MSEVFVHIVNMGITAGWLILAVLVVRFLFRKMPKTWHCFLWYLVLIRLLLPVSMESDFSLIPNSKALTRELLYSADPVSKVESVNIDGLSTYFSEEEKQATYEEYVSKLKQSSGSVMQSSGNVLSDSITPNPGDSVNPLQVMVYVASYVWFAGMLGMLLYAALSYLRVAKSIREAVLLKKNVYQCKHMESPFVLGVLRPRIYVPFSLDGEALECVLAHELAHLKRKDHVVRLIAFFVLSIYWFHPLVWIFYVLLCKDMELACDEAVLRHIGMDKKKLYSRTLLECSTHGKGIAACPLAFGETGVKQRVRNILSYKKPTFGLVIVAVLTFVAVIVCFMTNPVNDGYETGTAQTQYIEEERESEELEPDGAESEKSNTVLNENIYYPALDNSVERIEDSGAITEVLEDAPHLFLRDMLSSRYSDFNVSSGNYTWYVLGEEDEVGLVACGAHPMEEARNAEQLVVPNYNGLDAVTYYAGATVNPDRLTISVYDISDVGNVEAKPILQHTVEGNMIELRQNRIYTIVAMWKEEMKAERGFYGEAEYVVVTGDASAYKESQSQQPEITIAFTEDVNTLDGVTMVMEKYTATEGNVEIRNESGKELQYGNWYDIQVKMDDDRWYSLAMIIDNAGYEGIAYILADGTTSVWPINWSYFYGELPAGKYRMVKDVDDWRAPGDFTKYYIATEFEIK